MHILILIFFLFECA